MQKNVASQKLYVYVFAAATNLPITGDAANLTAYVAKDFGALTVLGDTSATEVDATNAKGYYVFDLTQAETNADTLLFSCKSTTGGADCECKPDVVYTTPIAGAIPAAVAGAAGGLPIIGGARGPGNLVRSGTCQAGSTGITIVLDAGASAVDGFYANCAVKIVAGTGAGQKARYLKTYTGSTKVGGVLPSWTTTPDGTSEFEIYSVVVDVAGIGTGIGTAPNYTTSGAGYLSSLQGVLAAYVATGFLPALPTNVYGAASGAGTTTSFTCDDFGGEAYTTAEMVGKTIVFARTSSGGAGDIERRLITVFDIETGQITFSPALATAVGNGDVFSIVPADMLNPAGEALIAAAVRDVNNLTPAADSLGSMVSTGGVAAADSRFTS
jgi:hypothetical protein